MKITKKQTANFLRQHWLILIIWAIGLFARCYRQDQLLGFYYDQARDAKMARDILTLNNLPAIGPTTGIQGLYLGPFWFYLITPGYLLGNGDPAIASWFIAFIESLSIPLIYLILKTYWNKLGGIVGASLWSFSYYIIRSSRWFSNPSPLPFFVLAIMWCLLKIFQDKKPKYWPLVFFLLGLSLQLEAASAVFFIPVIFLFALINFKSVLKTKFKYWFQSILAFGVLLLPQLAFEIKNNFFITKNFFGFLTGKVNSATGKSWDIPTLTFAKERIISYYEIFFSKLDTNTTSTSVIFLILFAIGLIILLRNFKKNKLVQLNILWLFVPLFLLLFFVGNYGNLYDYYLTGYFPAFFVLFAMGITYFHKSILNTLIIIVTFVLFYFGNVSFIKNYVSAGTDGPEHISLGNQKQAIEQVCENTKSLEYNLSVYVPPIIPHTYDYLMDWYVSNNKCTKPSQNNSNLVYAIYEVDPPHPERLNAWLQIMDSTAKIEAGTHFGGIYVQKRQRINNDK